MDSTFRVNRVDWRIKLTQYSKFLLRWGWFVALSIATITTCSFLIPDSLSANSYQATLQIQVPLPNGLNGLLTTNNTTTYFSSVLLSPSTLSLALPDIAKNEKFSAYQLTDLEGLVTAAPVTDTPEILLSTVSDTSQDASFLVTTVYNAFLHYLHDQRYSVSNELHSALTNELNHAETDFTNSSASLQSLNSIGKTSSFQYRELTSLNKAQRVYINSINALLLSLNSDIEGSNSTFGLSSSAPAITTQSAPSQSQHQRLALSLLVGFIMGVSGVLLASHFSDRLPLRGKKREAVIPQIMSVIPELVLPRSNKKSRAAAFQSTSPACLPLLLKLPYHFSEHEKPLRVISVTSPSKREGKSTIAGILATAAANRGLRALLVDANLQRPVLNTWYSVSNTTGLYDAISSLADEVISPSPVQSTSVTNLSIIPVGTIKRQQRNVNAESELLQVRELRSWIGLMREQVDLIIFDSGSLLVDPNAINLAALSDVTLLIVDAQRSKATKAREAEKVLKNLGIAFATVLNRADRNSVE